MRWGVGKGGSEVPVKCLLEEGVGDGGGHGGALGHQHSLRRPPQPTPHHLKNIKSIEKVQYYKKRKKNTREADDPIYINTIKSIRINKVVINKGPKGGGGRAGRWQWLWLLAFGGKFEHQDSLSGEAPITTLEPQDLGSNWKRALGAYYSQHWAGVKLKRLTTSLKLATFFLKDPIKHSFPNSLHAEDLPQRGGQGSELMHFGRWGELHDYESLSSLQPRDPLWNPRTRKMAPLKIQLICTRQALVTPKRRYD